MKVLIIRVPGMENWEMQNFYPIEEKAEMKYLTTTSSLIKHKNVIRVKMYHNILLRALGLHFIQPMLFYRLMKEDFDIIHGIEAYHYASFIAALVSKIRGKKFVFTQWETIKEHPIYTARFRWLFKKIAIKYADKIIAVNKRAKDCILYQGAKKNQVVVIPCGIDVKKFNPRTKNLKNKLKLKNKIVIVFVGRVGYDKGMQYLLKVFLKLEKEFKNIHLLIAGKGELDPLVREHQERSKNITHLGWINYKDLPSVYATGDIFCCLATPKKTWEEQFGFVYVEAMASGLPLIVSKTGAIPQVVSENEGLFMNLKNPEKELYNALKKLISNEELRNKMSRNSRKRAEEEYSHKSIAEKQYNLYKELLNNS